MTLSHVVCKQLSERKKLCLTEQKTSLFICYLLKQWNYTLKQHGIKQCHLHLHHLKAPYTPGIDMWLESGNINWIITSDPLVITFTPGIKMGSHFLNCARIVIRSQYAKLARWSWQTSRSRKLLPWTDIINF